MSFLWSLGSFLIVIVLLIFVHEYGHFWAARKCGIQVERFSIGFGKVLWRRRDKKNTEFVISAIPLGGYVKMLDERTEPVPATLAPQAFNNKTLGQRAFVIVAGPIANFIFAIVVYWVIYLIGIPTLKPMIGDTTPNSIAAQASLPIHSQIVTLDGKNIEDWDSLNMLLATKVGNASLTFGLSPLGQHTIQHKTVDLTHWQYDANQQSPAASLGLIPYMGKIELSIAKIVENSPAQQAQLQTNDKLLTINGMAITPQNLTSLIQQSQGHSIELTLERRGSLLTVLLTPTLNTEGSYQIGIATQGKMLDTQYLTELKYDVLESAIKAIDKVWQLCVLTLKVIGKLFSGNLSLNNLSGPISIAKGAGISSEIGFVYYLSFMALISVNLGIMNLFPLPVLDGGQLLFIAIEKILKRPLSEKIQAFFYRIGLFLLLILMVFALFNDIMRL